MRFTAAKTFRARQQLKAHQSSVSGKCGKPVLWTVVTNDALHRLALDIIVSHCVAHTTSCVSCLQVVCNTVCILYPDDVVRFPYDFKEVLLSVLLDPFEVTN